MTLNPLASNFTPTWVSHDRKYSLDFMRSLKPSVISQVQNMGWVAAGPFDRLPVPVGDIVSSCPKYIEFLDIEAAAAVMGGTRPKAVSSLVSGPPQDETAQLIASVRKRCREYVHGPFLAQSGDVVKNLLLVELALRFKKTSIKLRHAVEKCPGVVTLIRQFLCGEGFHIPPPLVNAHEQWRLLSERLKFDWIRDNRTKIFTELSKYWKKSNTPFEQFVHFFFFRDMPPPCGSKSMLAHFQKPIMVAALSGDVDSVVLLSDLGFFVPPDYYWELVGFVGTSTDPHFVEIRSMLCHFFQRQVDRDATTILRVPEQPHKRDVKNPWGK